MNITNMRKKGAVLLNPIDLVVGTIVIIGGFSIIFGYVNLGSFFAGIGLLIEMIKIVMKYGLK